MDTAVKLTFRLGPKDTGIARDALEAAQVRLERALREITNALEPTDMVQALSAPEDTEFLVRLITVSGALGGRANVDPDPIMAARLRGALVRDKILTGPEMLTAEKMGNAVGAQRQTVDNWRKAGKVLGLERGRRGYLYPSWQIVDHKLIPGLDRVLAALNAAAEPWRAYRFLISPEPRLEDRLPIDVLRAGDIDLVVEIAQMFGEQGG